MVCAQRGKKKVEFWVATIKEIIKSKHLEIFGSVSQDSSMFFGSTFSTLMPAAHPASDN